MISLYINTCIYFYIHKDFNTHFFWEVTLNQENFVHEDSDIYNVEVKLNGPQNLSLHLEDLVLVIGVVSQIAQGLHLSIILQTLTCKIKTCFQIADNSFHHQKLTNIQSVTCTHLHLLANSLNFSYFHKYLFISYFYMYFFLPVQCILIQ